MSSALLTDARPVSARARDLRRSTASESMYRAKKGRRRMPDRQGKPWTAGEDRQLIEAFRRGDDIEEIARNHGRSVPAVRTRLERRGLLPGPHNPSVTPQLATAPLQPVAGESTPLGAAVDGLIDALQSLKTSPTERQPFQRTVANVMKSYEQLNICLLAMAVATDPDTSGDELDLDPAPERLRKALADAVSACVANLKNRYVASLALGLVGDGQRATFAQMGRDMDVTGERARQRKVSAYRGINAVLPRRFATAQRIRNVLKEISADTDWTDPKQAAPHIVRRINDNYAAAVQLTVMCCKAAGASTQSRELEQTAREAVSRTCRDPDLYGRWGLDHWTDAASKTVFNGVQFFASPPESLRSRKRLTGNYFDPLAPNFRSEKLGRTVACESYLENRVLSWLEKSPEVLWYQEQPAVVPYVIDGMNTRYFPDAAAWDSTRRIVIVEAKPLYYMFRRETLIKALGALRHFEPQGMGYLLVDERGRTLAELASQPFDVDAALEVEKRFAEESMTLGKVRKALEKLCGEFDWIVFGSMVVNRDWAVSSEEPVSVAKLPNGVSFRPLR